MIAVQFSYCNGTHAMAKGNIWKYNVCRAPDTRKWWLHEMSGACLAWHGVGVSFLWHQPAHSPIMPPQGGGFLWKRRENNRETLVLCATGVRYGHSIEQAGRMYSTHIKGNTIAWFLQENYTPVNIALALFPKQGGVWHEVNYKGTDDASLC